MSEFTPLDFTCYQDKQNPGIVRFSDGDEFAGILVGMRAPEIVRAVNAYNELYAALRAVVFQINQGSVLERDACITQGRAALAKADGLPAEALAKSGKDTET